MTPRDLASVASHLHLPATATLYANGKLTLADANEEAQYVVFRGGRDVLFEALYLARHLDADLTVEVRIHDLDAIEASRIADRASVLLSARSETTDSDGVTCHAFTCDGGVLRIFGDKTEPTHGCSTCGREQEPNDPACTACVDADGWIGKVA